MVDYSKLSDFEINKRVALIIAPELSFHECYDANGHAVFHHKSGTCGFSFTRTPADAWPIIDENNITIINDHPEIRYAVNNLNAYRNGDNNCIVKSDSNGLRAAMIVFLMMQDANNG